MKSCTDCPDFESCIEPCERVNRWANRFKKSQREFPRSDIITVTPTSKALIADHTPLPDYPFLKPVERKILKYFLEDGLTYSQIAQRLKKSKTAVKSILVRSRAKIATFSSYSEGT